MNKNLYLLIFSLLVIAACVNDTNFKSASNDPRNPNTDWKVKNFYTVDLIYSKNNESINSIIPVLQRDYANDLQKPFDCEIELPSLFIDPKANISYVVFNCGFISDIFIVYVLLPDKTIYDHFVNSGWNTTPDDFYPRDITIPSLSGL